MYTVQMLSSTLACYQLFTLSKQLHFIVTVSLQMMIGLVVNKDVKYIYNTNSSNIHSVWLNKTKSWDGLRGKQRQTEGVEENGSSKVCWEVWGLRSVLYFLP